MLHHLYAILESKGYRIISDSRAGNNYGDVLKLDNGCIVNCYDKGTFNCQGKNCAEIKNILDNATFSSTNKNGKVFVVYGHDQVARTQLEAMLRRWDLEPLILDQLASSGNTIIEKLEEYITGLVKFFSLSNLNLVEVDITLGFII